MLKFYARAINILTTYNAVDLNINTGAGTGATIA